VKRWLQPIKIAIPAIKSATCTNRDGKHYVTVRFHDAKGGYENVQVARNWLARNGYPNARITSGGGSSGTIRINDNSRA